REVVDDLTQVIRLDSSHALAYNYRGNAYYKLGEYQQAVDDYNRAINLGMNEAVKSRDIALGVWEEIKRQAEEKIRGEERERQKREKEETEAEEKRQQELQGELFTFEVVTVNNFGEIINHTQGTTRQKREDLGNGIKLEMIYIPGGSFLMGSPENEAERKSNEGPQHEATIQPFYMSKYPITQNQYQTIMGNNPSSFKGESHPVERVSWHDAIEFCQKLSEKTGKIYTLPSESQWEYACRAGTTTPFYFGETITPELVNYDGNRPYGNAPQGKYRQQTISVGSFPPNAFGLYDMHGNVWEWCQDVWHENYNGAPTDGSAWETGGYSNVRVLRGACWINFGWYCRSARRVCVYADTLNYLRGFRIISSDLLVSSGF
ncbi:SUMF1/EgtB/PvdO family nonheme iron enzyme, partial [Okeania sp.]|uniref:SUMF1/EgtB/PvdO family nonheme iron enzyme n=1 Tax=Okeania sp. TaxID=3100323 RepID=UPI002B4B4390